MCVFSSVSLLPPPPPPPCVYVCVCMCMSVCVKRSAQHRQRDRQTDRHTHTQPQTEGTHNRDRICKFRLLARSVAQRNQSSAVLRREPAPRTKIPHQEDKLDVICGQGINPVCPAQNVIKPRNVIRVLRDLGSVSWRL